MNRDNLQDLMLGAVVVVLGYALYKHFKPSLAAQVGTLAGGQPQTTSAAFMAPQDYTQYDTANPGQFISVADLMRGAVADFFQGDKSGETFATIHEVNRSVTETGDHPDNVMRFWPYEQ